MKLSNQKKIFIKNFLSLSGIEILNKLLPFLIVPYLIRVLGIEKFGLLMFAIAMVQYFKAIADYGFDLYSTREIALNIQKKEQIELIFFTTIFIKLFLSIILFILFALIIESFEIFNNNEIIFYILYGIVFGYALLPTWFFQGMEQMKYITYAVVTARLFYIILLINFVKSPGDYLIAASLESGSIIIAGIVAFFLAIFKFDLKLILPNLREIKKQLKDAWNIFLLDFVPNFYNNFTTFFLGVIGGNTIVGYYSVAYKISSATVMLINILRNITYPYLNKNFRYFNNVKIVLLSAGAVLSLLLFLFKDYLIILFMGKESLIVSNTLAIIALSPFIIAVSATYGTNYLLIHKYDKIYRKIVFNISIFGFLNAIWLIKFFSIYGAAITLVTTRGLIAIFVYKKYKDKTNGN